MSENKIGDVVVLKTETQQQAHYQLADGTSVFLCALALDAYENIVLREQFFALATDIVLARIRATGSNVTLVQRDPSRRLKRKPVRAFLAGPAHRQLQRTFETGFVQAPSRMLPAIEARAGCR